MTLTNSSKSPVHTRKISAKQAGVSEDTYRKGKLILKEAPFELKEKYRKGDVSTNEAYKQVKAAEKAEAKAAIVERIKNEPMPIPEGPFRVIVIDPPWPYESRAEDPTHRAKTPYPSMRLEEIAALPVPELAHKDCILWLWTTNAFMHEAFHLLEGWGFQSKTILTWVKSRMGVGDWLRGQTEHCLMAIRGKPIVILTNETTALVADNKDHSTKPVDFYTRVESLCPGSKLEMFARQKREGWEQWGSERFYDIPDNPVPILGQGYGKGKTEYKLAKLAGIGHGTFHKIQAIDREASEDLKRRVDAGEISINRAYQEIGMRKKEGGISHKAENPAFAIIRDMTLKGQPNRVIAEELNRRKVPRLSGISKPWHGRDVYEVRARSMPSIFPRPRDVSTLPPETQTPEKLHNNILFRATMVNGDIESKVALVEQICRNVSEGIMESHIAEYHNNEHDVGACAMEGY